MPMYLRARHMKGVRKGCDRTWRFLAASIMLSLHHSNSHDFHFLIELSAGSVKTDRGAGEEGNQWNPRLETHRVFFAFQGKRREELERLDSAGLLSNHDLSLEDDLHMQVVWKSCIRWPPATRLSPSQAGLSSLRVFHKFHSLCPLLDKGTGILCHVPMLPNLPNAENFRESLELFAHVITCIYSVLTQAEVSRTPLRGLQICKMSTYITFEYIEFGSMKHVENVCSPRKGLTGLWPCFAL
jgi:hypothetical protein